MLLVVQDLRGSETRSRVVQIAVLRHGVEQRDRPQHRQYEGGRLVL